MEIVFGTTKKVSLCTSISLRLVVRDTTSTKQLKLFVLSFNVLELYP